MAQGKEAASTQSGPAPRSPSGPGTRRPAACRRPGAPRARLEAQTRTAAAGARPSLRAAERKRNGPTSGPSARLGHTLTPPQSGSALQPEGLRGFRRTGCQRGPLGLEPGHVVLKMSLVLRNLQRAVPIRRAPLRKKLEIVRSILGVQKFDLAIVCVDNKSIQHINKIYREKNLPTDVLSFPFHENVKAGELPQPDFPDDYNLGDIFLGVEYIFQQCKGNEDYYDVLTGILELLCDLKQSFPARAIVTGVGGLLSGVGVDSLGAGALAQTGLLSMGFGSRASAAGSHAPHRPRWASTSGTPCHTPEIQCLQGRAGPPLPPPSSPHDRARPATLLLAGTPLRVGTPHSPRYPPPLGS
ncbi:endoribonuclease YbeY isoform X2 [Lynx canadensis]|uniref:endoribonuclease YbeY isoform X2 n=1 Tax=Lynx canadensis TaxID=61383 RepID=UPI0011B09FC8|nr:endoribonuclease YbeY isoform X2 [Lynx canadensis]